MGEGQNKENTEGNQESSHTNTTSRLLQWFGLENPDGQYPWKHSNREVFMPVFGITMFSLPAILILFVELPPFSNVQGILSRSLLSALVFGGVLLFLLFTPRTGERATSQVDEWPQIPENADIDIVNREDTWLTEYQEISEEARYRDRLLLRTTYFSLGIFALLVGILIELRGEPVGPAITVVGSLLALVFTIAVNSYKDTRDSLWKEQRKIEKHPKFHQKLTVHHTVRTSGQRRLFNRLSLSSTTLTLHVFFVLVWVSSYLAFIWL